MEHIWAASLEYMWNGRDQSACFPGGHRFSTMPGGGGGMGVGVGGFGFGALGRVVWGWGWGVVVGVGVDGKSRRGHLTFANPGQVPLV